MIVGIGTDIIKLSRISSSYDRLGDRFAQRILSPSEWNDFKESAQPLSLLAKRFAVKEAAGKALGTGIGQGVSWHDISVEHDELGAPLLMLKGRAAEHAAQKGVNNTQLSISDETDLAIAFVVLSKD